MKINRKSKIIRIKIPFIDGYPLKILLTNHLKLGISIKKTPYSLFHLNLFTCQFVFFRIGFYIARNRFGQWLYKKQFRVAPLFIYFY